MTIEQASEQFGVPLDKLHFYEDQGLFDCHKQLDGSIEYTDNFILKIDHTYAEESILNEVGKIDYGVFKPILFEMPGYTYLKTGETVAKCMTLGKKKNK